MCSFLPFRYSSLLSLSVRWILWVPRVKVSRAHWLNVWDWIMWIEINLCTLASWVKQEFVSGTTTQKTHHQQNQCRQVYRHVNINIISRVPIDTTWHRFTTEKTRDYYQGSTQEVETRMSFTSTDDRKLEIPFKQEIKTDKCVIGAYRLYWGKGEVYWKWHLNLKGKETRNIIFSFLLDPFFRYFSFGCTVPVTLTTTYWDI